MNIQPSEAKRLTLWEYDALLHKWNEAHRLDSDDGADVEPMPVEDFQDMEQYFLDHPELLN